MKTRFDKGCWITARGELLTPTEMSTNHAMNILRMLVTSPDVVVRMITLDLEDGTFADGAWSPAYSADKKDSIHNATSMTAREIHKYVMDSPLGMGLIRKLEADGVNTKNLVELFQELYTKN